ncbi:class I SAM-dependent methyltransferase [Dysgonomonas sp. Marseille-P4677]|uniref:class I SAM-dependent methyltransferase n=1 Tax=Dysgonomonas sp. Marseille-P4677 TaxID=2364790 RepID=UPI001913CF47|nr:class I SAM-dependent methyltransferase [Dysgonomonas sp. Marseille-P4677]MBK5723029.1 class I SAM-dependent methyltransferase [Dysgonomonas sp. Marseille-P4677]
MKTVQSKSVCPVESAGGLDMPIRKWLQNPRKILQPYIKNNMSVLDFGCGTGYFTIEIARLLNGTGKVVTADLQQGMLDILKTKIKQNSLKYDIYLHKCEENSIGLNEKFDFILAFYMFHEVPNQEVTIKELKTLLNPNGKILIIEPKIHVSKNDFRGLEKFISNNGFKILGKPDILFSMSLLFSLK